ncbi:MAG: DUF1570 domain-containing protein [Myxococcota bacterium]|nr:DUF1570 domain-containing protein [Deltaproteobacteria bacterium]MDQ3339298.1 DUF1570 domain-containing protein [Myxococcota bacterium]
MRLALLLVLAACHGAALPALPSKGGPVWIEVQSEHFTVWTDAPRTRISKLVREMEHLRQVVLGVGFAGTRIEGRSFVLALRDGEEVGVFVPEQFVAFAFYGGALRQPGIVLPADANENDIVTHELVHVISFNVIRNQPRWFAEGLAGFFETVNVDPDTSNGDVGQPNKNIVARLRITPPTPVAKMFGCDAYACMDDMFYATAWAMFSYLANTHPNELIEFSRRIDELPAGQWMQAWTENFPKLAPSELDHQIRKWLAYGKHTVWKFDVKLQEWPVTERVLRDADVYAARALLRERFRKVGEPQPSELAAALAADPTHLIANLVKVEYTKSIDVALAKRIAAAHPDDWRAWWLVALGASWQGDEARAAWTQACALPDSPRDWCKR